MSTQTATSVGYSSYIIKPRGEKDIALPSQAGKVRYEVEGPGIMRPTFIYLLPHQVASKIQKYRQKHQRLIGPGISLTTYESPVETPIEVEITESAIIPEAPLKVDGRTLRGKPVVDCSTGKYYEKIQAAHRATGICATAIGYAVNGRCRHAYGHTFRYATAEEVQQRCYIGEIVPLATPRR